jgi:hypothetical protein
MYPGCSDSFSTCVNIFQPSTTIDGSGYSQVISVSSTQVKVRMYLNGPYDFYSQTFRLVFRYYFGRLTFSGTCSIANIYSSRYGNNYWCLSGSCSATCGNLDRQIYASFYMYRAQTSQYQWPYWYGGDYLDLTFTFGSVGGDVSNNANQLFVQGTLVWENTAYYYNNIGKCGCCGNCCCNTCYQSCLVCDCCSCWY